jgi:hypothetical protein
MVQKHTGLNTYCSESQSRLQLVFQCKLHKNDTHNNVITYTILCPKKINVAETVTHSEQTHSEQRLFTRFQVNL